MIRIKNSVGDKLLEVTIEIPPLSKALAPKQTPVNLEKFLLGKWTWLVDDGCFSFCQEVTQQEREDFNNFIASSRLSYEKIYHMPIPEFINIAIASSQIDWIPATHPIIENIAKHPFTARTKKYRDQLERFINLGQTEDYSAHLYRIKVPKDIEKIYRQHTETKETHTQQSAITESSSELTTAAQVSENSERESSIRPDRDLEGPQEDDSKPPSTTSNAKEVKKRKFKEKRLNAVQEYIKKHLKKEPNADPTDIWNAIKDEKPGDLEIDSDENKLKYRIKSFSKEFKDNEGKKKFSQRTYDPEKFAKLVSEMKDKFAKTEEYKDYAYLN